MMTMKVCKKCEIKKEISDFHKLSNSKDGYRFICKKCRIEESKTNYENNKNQYNKQSLNWNINNPIRRKEIIKKYKQNTYVRFKENLRHRVYMFLKTKKMKKNNPTFKIVGKTPEELRLYIENKFLIDMTWENYGKWHIDHIIPLDSAQNVSELYKLFYYTNLQPLWAIDNLKKGKKIQLD